jgi:hypothetical protein
MSLKFLDYSDPVPFSGIIGKARNLAWPVHAYRVTLPRATDGGDGLNPFERVVLKLLDAIGAMDASTLADETRIPLDLVNSILLRLRDKALIDEHNRIIEQEDDDSVGGEENAPVFVTAILFRELVTGKILPFLHWLDETNPLRTKDEVRQFLTIPLDDAHKVNPPAPRDVISVLRAVNKRSTVSGGGVSMPSVQQITIIRQPESYCLDCPIAIQKSDGEFRIADPFGNGFSLILEGAFEKLLDQGGELAEWLQRWKLLLSNPSPTKPGDTDQRLREPFESEVNLQRYPKLVASLRPSQEKQFRSIAKIYASIEWALFYVCCRSPLENAISKLKFTGQSQHPKLLESAALSIGLEAQEHNFRPIREGKILDFHNGKAELDTVLAINILQAQVDESHPLRRIAFSHPNIISRLLGIKKMRDEKSHGKGNAGQTETELSEDPLMRETVHYLLPDIIFAKQASVVRADMDARADDLLDARTSIQNEFSFKVFNRLGTNLQNRLIHAERFWHSCKDDSNDARSFADDLYAAVQSTFEKRLDGKLPPYLSDSEFVSAAGKKASAAGLSEALPNCLSKVKTLAIRQTLQGSGQTLGACTMAFLLMSEGDTLHSIAAMQPSFVDDIANVITTRGHGNEPLPLPKADVKILRKASYTTIKTLMEA